MVWVWILIGISIVLNIVSLVVFMQHKKLYHVDKIDEVQAIQQSMEAFVTKMESENDELYQKLVYYIKAKRNADDERLRALEEKVRSFEEQLEVDGTSESMNDAFLDEQETRNLSNPPLPSTQNQEEERVLQLFKQGFSPKQIAKVLQIDNGKVELIINMFKKRRN